jgi:hypothetical protein
MDPCSKFCGTMFLMNVVFASSCVIKIFKLELYQLKLNYLYVIKSN